MEISVSGTVHEFFLSLIPSADLCGGNEKACRASHQPLCGDFLAAFQNAVSVEGRDARSLPTKTGSAFAGRPVFRLV
jgi:hypothetical protein